MSSPTSEQIAHFIAKVVLIGIDIGFVWAMAWILNPPIESSMVWFIAVIIGYAMECNIAAGLRK